MVRILWFCWIIDLSFEWVEDLNTLSLSWGEVSYPLGIGYFHKGCYNKVSR
jgi:hypothetical protein